MLAAYHYATVYYVCMLPILLILYVAAFGVVIGSFVNVLILRDGRRASIVTGRSGCPSCGHVLHWYELIPVISFVLQMGRCRSCKASLSLQYPTVELLVGMLLFIAFWKVGLSIAVLPLWIWFICLVVLSGIDIRTQSVPLDYCIAAGVMGLLYQFLQHGTPGLLQSLIGAGVGAAIILAIIIVWKVLTKTDGMGTGDIWILAAIGSLLGYPLVIQSLFFAVMLGSIGGVLAIVRGGGNLKTEIPFGPYLAVGAVIALLLSKELLQWYTLLWI